MREYLYRGFHPDKNGTTEITLNGEKIKGEWLIGDGIRYPKAINYKGTCWIDGVQERANGWLQVLPETVGESTGLPDKNGNAIFEGYIVKLTPPKESSEIYVPTPHNPQEDRILEVVFFDGMFAVDMRKWFKYGHGRVALGSYETERLEIVGNIFENLDLLGSGEKKSERRKRK